jgi:hypothetical protein
MKFITLLILLLGTCFYGQSQPIKPSDLREGIKYLFEGAEAVETLDAANILIDSLKAANNIRDKRIANLINEVNNEKDKVNVKDVVNNSLQEQLSVANADKIKAQKEAEKEERSKRGWKTFGLVAGAIILVEVVIVALTVF